MAEHVITRALLLRAYAWLGVIQSLAALAAFYFLYWTHGYWGQWLDLPASGPLYRAATAMTLASVVATQIGNLLAQRTESTSVFRMRWGRNRLVWVGIATELVLLALLLYVPVLQRLFDTAPCPCRTGCFSLPGRPSCSSPMKAARPGPPQSPWEVTQPCACERLSTSASGFLHAL